MPFERPVDRAGELAGRPGVVRFIDVAPVRAVMVDGDGQPGGAARSAAPREIPAAHDDVAGPCGPPGF